MPTCYAIVRRMLAAAAIGSLLGIASAAGAHPPQFHSAGLVPFEPPPAAPGFALQDLDGATVRLADYRGRFVLLNFWATWCPPCLAEMPSLDRLAKQLSQAPFHVVAVSLDSKGVQQVRPFVAKLGVSFRILLNPDGSAADAYGANELPTTFLIDPQGRVVAAAKGDRDWTDERIVSYLREVIGEGS